MATTITKLFPTGILQSSVEFDEVTLSTATTGSAQFSGSNYLSVAGGTGTAMGTGDFTWECWVYPTSSSGYQVFIDTRTSPLTGGDTTGFYFGTNTGTLTPMYYTNGLQLASSINITLNAWNHVALTRNSGIVTLWVNGVSGGTKSDTTNLTQQRVFIGGTSQGVSTGLLLTGKITNVRIVKGTAVYTALFTVPTTALTAITGTQLLLLEDTSANLLKDSSTNNFTVTNNGTVTWSATSPSFASSSAIRVSTTGVYASQFDEVNLAAGTAERRTSTGTYLVSGYFDEYTYSVAPF
jgi:hypothetical protein